jgi:hypothetical protein
MCFSEYVTSIFSLSHLGGCIQKFLDWLPGARTANGTALCHFMQLYHYFMSQSSEFCHHNPLCCFSTCVCCCKCIFCYDSVWKLLDTPSYDTFCKQLRAVVSSFQQYYAALHWEVLHIFDLIVLTELNVNKKNNGIAFWPGSIVAQCITGQPYLISIVWI